MSKLSWRCRWWLFYALNIRDNLPVPIALFVSRVLTYKCLRSSDSKLCPGGPYPRLDAWRMSGPVALDIARATWLKGTGR